MGHYAKVQDGKVVQVIVADSEAIAQALEPGQWVQTSYNTRGGVHFGEDGLPDGGAPLRKNFAGIGFTHDPVRDAFIPPKPYESWVLDEDTCLWEAPVPRPQDGGCYGWDEATGGWTALAL